MERSGGSPNISNNKARNNDDSSLLKAKDGAICILQALTSNICINSKKEVLLLLYF